MNSKSINKRNIMTQDSPISSLSVEQRLNLETAKINWIEIQRFFAQGRVLIIQSNLDLVEISKNFVLDNKEMIEELLDQGAIIVAETRHAQKWNTNNSFLWAVVVAPWVLVQEVKS